MARIVTLTKEEWLNQGFELFGDDTYSWLFKCPVCGYVQCFNDFDPYLDIGANPDDAFSTCIGVYHRASGATGPFIGCSYSSKRQVIVSPMRVEGPNGVFYSFAFAKPDRQPAWSESVKAH